MKPTPEQVRQARINANLCQEDAAALVSSSVRSWQYWEAGKVRMPAAKYELFITKTRKKK